MTDDKQVQLIATLIAKPGKEEALLSALLAIVPAVKQEPGCIAYIPHISRERAGKIVMYEVWADEAAHATHKQAPSLTGLAARFDELLDKPLHVETLWRPD